VAICIRLFISVSKSDFHDLPFGEAEFEEAWVGFGSGRREDCLREAVLGCRAWAANGCEPIEGIEVLKPEIE